MIFRNRGQAGAVVQGVSQFSNFREISGEPALRLPGVEEALRTRFRDRIRYSASYTVIVAGLAAGCLVLGSWWGGAALTFFGVCAAVAALFGLVLVRQRIRSRREMLDILRAYTWRECRANIRTVNADADIELTDVDGNLVCHMTAFRFDLRWVDANAQSEVVWFAGDLRFGGVLGQRGDVVGAELLGQDWTLRVHRVPPSRERGSDLADRTAREAGLVPKDWQPV